MNDSWYFILFYVTGKPLCIAADLSSRYISVPTSSFTQFNAIAVSNGTGAAVECKHGHRVSYLGNWYVECCFIIDNTMVLC